MERGRLLLLEADVQNCALVGDWGLGIAVGYKAGETIRESDNANRMRSMPTGCDKHCGDCTVCNLNLFYEQAFEIPHYCVGHVSRWSFV
jgi:hypothetical protein